VDLYEEDKFSHNRSGLMGLPVLNFVRDYNSINPVPNFPILPHHVHLVYHNFQKLRVPGLGGRFIP